VVLLGVGFAGWGIWNSCEPYAEAPYSWWAHPLIFALGWLEFPFIAFMNMGFSDSAFNLCKQENWMALNIRFPELKWVVLASFGYVMLIEIIEGVVKDSVDSDEVVIKSRATRKIKPSEENILVSKDVQNKIKKIKSSSRTTKSIQPEKTTKVASKSVATRRANKGVSLAGKKSK
jgi:hypothetical protein